jgi:hypothetical protein
LFDELGEEIAPFNTLSAALEAIVDVESRSRPRARSWTVLHRLLGG